MAPLGKLHAQNAFHRRRSSRPFHCLGSDVAQVLPVTSPKPMERQVLNPKVKGRRFYGIYVTGICFYHAARRSSGAAAELMTAAD